MSPRLVKALGTPLAVVVAVTVLGSSPAAADGHHGTSSVTTTVPEGGTSAITSPTLPSDQTTVKVELTTSDPDAGLLQLAYMMMQLPSPGRRVLGCMSLVGDRLLSAEHYDSVEDLVYRYEGVEQTELLVRLSTCLYVASLVSEFLAGASPKVAERAGTSCDQQPFGIKESIVQESDGYHLTSAAPPTRRKRNVKVKVRCTVVSPTKVVMSFKPRKKGSTLRKALRSKNLRLALAAPSSADGGTKVKVTFKIP